MSPVKEPKFFALEGEQLVVSGPGSHAFRPITEFSDYCSLFEEVSNEIAIGEASTIYLYVPKAPERIKHYIPHVKLIAILRHPVDRAYSSFMHLRRDEREPLADFSQALKEEETRIKQGYPFIWRYKDRGFYYTQLKRYFDVFDRSQIKVYLYEDFSNNQIGILQDIFKFLGVDEKFIPDVSRKHNVSTISKNVGMSDFLNKSKLLKDTFKKFLPDVLRERIKNNFYAQKLPKPQMPVEVQKQLLEVYRDDILQLEKLLDRDLHSWLELQE